MNDEKSNCCDTDHSDCNTQEVNCCSTERVREWLVALAGTKLVKENEPVGKSTGFSAYT